MFAICSMVFISGCIELPASEEPPKCVTDSDCLEGWMCIDKECRAPEAYELVCCKTPTHYEWMQIDKCLASYENVVTDSMYCDLKEKTTTTIKSVNEKGD